MCSVFKCKYSPEADVFSAHKKSCRKAAFREHHLLSEIITDTNLTINW